MLDIYRIVDFISEYVHPVYRFDYSYYNLINTWMQWYKGDIDDFHTYQFYNGIETIECERAKIHMAKQVCADTAAMAFNENVMINIKNKKESEFIQGLNQNGGVFRENNFWENASQLYEGSVCALGTGAFEVYLEDIIINGMNKIIPSSDTKIRIGFIRADHILPITFENKIITEVCFINYLTIDDVDYADLRLHLKNEGGTYYIVNKRVRCDEFGNIIESSLPDKTIKEFQTGSKEPFFSIIKTSFNNNFDDLGNNPLGISIYANAIDILKSCDLAYDTLMNEIMLGQKFIFLNKSMLDLDEEGRNRTPYDLRQRLFQFIGDEALAGTDNWVYEFSPTLRVDELTKALEKQMDYLSAKVGLGDHFYKFSDGSVAKTATEVVSENSSAYRNIRRAQLGIEQPLVKLVRCLLYCGKNFLNLNLDVNVEIDIDFDASVIENKDAIRQRDIEEVNAGIITREEYRDKYHSNLNNEGSN